jgi:hypothetical protein
MKMKRMPDSPNLFNTDPIFILGMSQRSGTNFLADLLCLHPDCGLPEPIWEDHILHHAAPLIEYADSLYRVWYTWIGNEFSKESIYQKIGDGLLSILASRARRRRIVTKTPSVHNLALFFDLFPSAYLLILVRDGRSVVESQLKMTGGSFELAVHRWAEAAEVILRFDEAMKGSGLRYLIVRYEGLWNHLPDELNRIFDFLDLDPEVYDFNAAGNLPVRGSSVFGRGSGKVHWLPVERTADFNPLARWTHWNRLMHKRFNWLAGRQMRALGYEAPSGSDHILWVLLNRALDVFWAVGQFLNSARRAFRALLRQWSPSEKRLLPVTVGDRTFRRAGQ